MTSTEAERKAAQRIRNQAKDRTPEEQAALLEKTRQLNWIYKQNERKRKKDMRDVQSEGIIHSTSNSSSLPDVKTSSITLSMTGSAIRQRRYREKMKEEKVGKLAIQETASLETTEPLETIFDPYYDLNWSVAEVNRVDELPKYETGLIQRCSNELQGKDAMAAMMLEGLAAYLQSREWYSDEMGELLGLADTSPAKVTGIRKLNGGRHEFFVQAGSYIPSAFKSILKYSEEVRRGTPGLELTDDDLSKFVVIILDFVKKRARYMIPNNYDLQNFGYIVSRGPVKEQDMHIDLNSRSQY
jgi:hypothetical protein